MPISVQLPIHFPPILSISFPSLRLSLPPSSFKPSQPLPSPLPLAAAAASFPSSSSPSPLSNSFPFSRQSPTEEIEDRADDENFVIGDCLVFEEDAFEIGDPCDRAPVPPSPPNVKAEYGSLVPDKWEKTVREINLTKKEKRRIAHEQRFGSKLEERRSHVAVVDTEEYRAYRELKLTQLKPVVLDNPRQFLKEEEEEEEEVVAMEPPKIEGRVTPRNPRLELSDNGTLDDIADLFNSESYVPVKSEDDNKPQGRRKLFTQEEKVLLNKRIPNLAEATSRKWIPLHSLAASGEFYLLDTLLKHNVEINAVDKDGLSVLHKAILCKKQAIINYLLRNSANPFVRDQDGATLLHYAVQIASSQTIKILLLYNIDINLSDDDGWTPLHLAVQTKRTDIVRLLLIKGADRNLRNQDGLTPLHLCLYCGHDLRTFELVKLLKELQLSK